VALLAAAVAAERWLSFICVGDGRLMRKGPQRAWMGLCRIFLSVFQYIFCAQSACK